MNKTALAKQLVALAGKLVTGGEFAPGDSMTKADCVRVYSALAASLATHQKAMKPYDSWVDASQPDGISDEAQKLADQIDRNITEASRLLTRLIPKLK